MRFNIVLLNWNIYTRRYEEVSIIMHNMSAMNTSRQLNISTNNKIKSYSAKGRLGAIALFFEVIFFQQKAPKRLYPNIS